MVDVWRGDWSDVSASFAPMPVADGIAIHHTASAAHPANYDPQVLRNLEYGEMAVGYNALAYHTMVFDDGFLAEARPYGAMGAATGGHNGHTIAFCFIGYFHPPYYHQASDESLRSVASEIAKLVALGYLSPGYIVRPHTWWTAGTQWATDCCGSELIPKVPIIEAWSHAMPTPIPLPQEDDVPTVIRVTGEPPKTVLVTEDEVYEVNPMTNANIVCDPAQFEFIKNDVRDKFAKKYPQRV